jgi:hypothetical protein
LPFHFWIVLSIGLPLTVHRLLVKLADLLIEIVQRRHLLPRKPGVNVWRCCFAAKSTLVFASRRSHGCEPSLDPPRLIALPSPTAA